MFKIDDYVMYGTTGVCKVIDITKEKIMNNKIMDYYVLSPIYSKNTIIKTPVGNKKVNMRTIISQEDVCTLIDNITNESIPWIDDEYERIEKFKSMIKSGDCENLIRIIRTVYFNVEYKKLIGNKVTKRGENMMDIAENMLNEEFATVLGILPDEVLQYIESRI